MSETQLLVCMIWLNPEALSLLMVSGLFLKPAGWHYLHDYAENACGPDVVRRMLVHVAEAEASFAQWTSRAANRKNRRGACSSAAFSGEVVDAITKSRKEERC